LIALFRKGSKELEKQNQAMRSMFAMTRAPQGGGNALFVTSTSEADKEQQVETQSRTQKGP